jgi:hypothetical protein
MSLNVRKLPYIDLAFAFPFPDGELPVNEVFPDPPLKK